MSKRVKLSYAFVLCLSLVAILAFVSSWNMHVEEEAQNQQNSEVQTYEEEHSYRYALGQTATLDSEEDVEGDAYNWEASFTWEGTMKSTVERLELLAPDDKSLDGWVDDEDIELAENETTSAVRVLVATIVLENVDASADFDDEFGKYAFHTDNIALDDDLGTGEWAIFEPALSSERGSDESCYFEVKPGKSKTIHLGWFVGEGDLEDGVVISYGIRGNDKYAVEVSSDEIERDLP